jgi:hypothetical protein
MTFHEHPTYLQHPPRPHGRSCEECGECFRRAYTRICVQPGFRQYVPCGVFCPGCGAFQPDPEAPL